MTTAVLNTKIGEIENKIPFLIVSWQLQFLLCKLKKYENKKPVVSGLVKNTDYDTKISEIEGKYLTTSTYSNFMTGILHAKVKEK